MSSDDPEIPATVVEYQSPSLDRPPRRTPVRWILCVLIAIAILVLIVGSMPIAGPRGQEARNRAISLSNLRAVGQATSRFSHEHGGQYPNSLADLLGDGMLPRNLVSPFTGDQPALLSTPPTTRQAAQALAQPGHCSYVYLGAGKGWTASKVQPDAVVAYEPASGQMKTSLILFGDGNAAAVDQVRANNLINAATASTQPVSAATVP